MATGTPSPTSPFADIRAARGPCRGGPARRTRGRAKTRGGWGGPDGPGPGGGGGGGVYGAGGWGGGGERGGNRRPGRPPPARLAGAASRNSPRTGPVSAAS